MQGGGSKRRRTGDKVSGRWATDAKIIYTNILVLGVVGTGALEYV